MPRALRKKSAEYWTCKILRPICVLDGIRFQRNDAFRTIRQGGETCKQRHDPGRIIVSVREIEAWALLIIRDRSIDVWHLEDPRRT